MLYPLKASGLMPPSGYEPDYLIRIFCHQTSISLTILILNVTATLFCLCSLSILTRFHLHSLKDTGACPCRSRSFLYKGVGQCHCQCIELWLLRGYNCLHGFSFAYFFVLPMVLCVVSRAVAR